MYKLAVGFIQTGSLFGQPTGLKKKESHKIFEGILSQHSKDHTSRTVKLVTQSCFLPHEGYFSRWKWLEISEYVIFQSMSSGGNV